MRLSPLPSQTGVVYEIQPVGQMRAPRFKSLSQYLNPIPDDFEWAFKQGFFAECYHRSSNDRIRARYDKELQLWMDALTRAVRQADGEMEDVGFYPGTSVMDTDYGFYTTNNPARPFGW